MSRTIEMNATEYISKKKTIWIKPNYTAWSYRSYPTWLVADAPSSAHATHLTMRDTGEQTPIKWYVEKTAAVQGNSAGVHVPKSWHGRRIKCVLLD